MDSVADTGASAERNGHGRFAEPFANRPGRVWVTDPGTGEALGQIDLDGTSATTARTASQSAIDATFFALVADMAGAPRELLDIDTGDVAGRVSQSLYGRRTWRGGVSSLLLFAGQYEDTESGWVYNRFRFYDPVAGVYGAQDPLGVAPKIATAQGYVDHAIGFVDPLGLQAHIRPNSSQPYRGGSHGHLSSVSGAEKHHLISAQSLRNTRADSYYSGSAIHMERSDHLLTASHGSKPGAAEYRNLQTELLNEGRGSEAIHIDIAYNQKLFGEKYDGAMLEAWLRAADRGTLTNELVPLPKGLPGR